MGATSTAWPPLSLSGWESPSVPSATLRQYTTPLEISDVDFVSSHSELHHYTTLSGLSGIIQSNTIWATHFSNLNDASEVMLLRDPLSRALATRFLSYLLTRQSIDPHLRAFIKQRGGSVKVANSDAHQLIKILYTVTFDNSFAEPFITSFCSHDQPYEKEHGLLSQWRGYGIDGGFCIVFDTAALLTLLQTEFNAHNWVHLKIAPVFYAIEGILIESIFPELLARCEYFCERMLDRGNPISAKEGLAPFLFSSATRFKHQGFREEREVRIVGIPATKEVLASVLDRHPEYGSPDRMKNINVRDGR